MTGSESRLQRDNWEAVARAIDALPGVNATTSHEVKERGLEHAHYWNTHWIVSITSLVVSYGTGANSGLHT